MKYVMQPLMGYVNHVTLSRYNTTLSAFKRSIFVKNCPGYPGCNYLCG